MSQMMKFPRSLDALPPSGGVNNIEVIILCSAKYREKKAKLDVLLASNFDNVFLNSMS